MKILVASDIHGSAFYTEQLIKKFKEEKADRILLLGDILYHGARNDLPQGYDTKKVVALLNEYAPYIWAVRGNCDSEVDQMVLDFNISADMMPIYLEGTTVIASHGHVYSLENLPKYQGPFLFLFGHIHLPLADKTSFGYAGNPGSVSLPKGGNPPSYGILTKDNWVVKDFGGNILTEIMLNFD